MMDEMKEAMRQARSDIDIFTTLVEHKAWARLKEISAAQLESKVQTLVTCTEENLRLSGISPDFERGFIAAIKLYMSYPDLIIKSATETLERNRSESDEHSSDD